MWQNVTTTSKIFTVVIETNYFLAGNVQNIPYYVLNCLVSGAPWGLRPRLILGGSALQTPP